MLISSFLPSTGGQGSEQRHCNSQAEGQGPFTQAIMCDCNNKSPEKKVKERMDAIIDFAEIGDFIDERVRNYSSGMYMRLAFAIAINVDADILLVDEILAVGDIRFQNKCLERLKQFNENGGTIVLVTHNTNQAKEMCNNVLWIDNGKIKEYGPSKQVCDHYYKEMTEK